jgi:hypothetical protein
MEQKAIKKITTHIHKQFPEFAGCRPKVRKQNGAHAKSLVSNPTYLLTFQSKASTKSKTTFTRWIRVVVNERGKILKISTSK